MNITRDMIDWTDDEKPVVTVNGKRYQVELPYDTDSTPFDADCYSPEDQQAWRDDAWHYVGVIVTPLDVPEDKQFELSDSLWGLEFNLPLDPPQEHGGHTYNSTNASYQVTVYPVPDIIDEVTTKVEAWEAAVSAEKAKEIKYPPAQFAVIQSVLAVKPYAQVFDGDGEVLILCDGGQYLISVDSKGTTSSAYLFSEPAEHESTNQAGFTADWEY